MVMYSNLEFSGVEIKVKVKVKVKVAKMET
jgi:hypothetical protein